MSAPSLERLNYVGGRLAINPTDLSTAWPHGGTGLGLVRDAAAKVKTYAHAILEEPWGGEPSEVVHGGESVTFVAILRTWDADALGLVYPAGSTGATTGERVVSYPGSFLAGAGLYGSAVKLLFTPTDQENHPAALFYSAMAVLADDVELAYQLDKENETAARFVCARDGSARVYALGRLRDLSL